MAGLEINETILIILGVAILVAVVILLYSFFKNQVIDFFSGFGGKAPNLFLVLIKK